MKYLVWLSGMLGEANMSDIQINNTEITIRPSSVDSFLGCAYQWANVFLGGITTIPSGRAAIGTGIHAGAELVWNESIMAKTKIVNVSAAVDASIETFQEQVKDYGIKHDHGEDDNTAEGEIRKGVEAFCEDVVPFVEIPDAVELRYSMDISDHPIVSRISGTVDYIGGGVIADVKTSKRKPTVQNYEIQQSIYKILAEHNGVTCNHSHIHSVVLTKAPYGGVFEMQPNVPKAKTVVNNLLDTLEVLAKGVVDPDILFRGNPKYYLCSPKYCSLYPCKFVKGEAVEAPKEAIKL